MLKRFAVSCRAAYLRAVKALSVCARMSVCLCECAYVCLTCASTLYPRGQYPLMLFIWPYHAWLTNFMLSHLVCCYLESFHKHPKLPFECSPKLSKSFSSLQPSIQLKPFFPKFKTVLTEYISSSNINSSSRYVLKFTSFVTYCHLLLGGNSFSPVLLQAEPT